MKKQLTYEVGEKPTFDNEFDIKQTMQFLIKAEETVKLYNKHQMFLLFRGFLHPQNHNL